MPEAASILLVDDNASLRRVVEYQLAEAGYAITSVASGEQALEVLRRRAFHLVLSDVLMPGMSVRVIAKPAAAPAQGKAP